MKLEESIDIVALPENIWPLLVKRESVFAVDPLVKRFDFVGEQYSGVGTTFYMKKKLMGDLSDPSVNLPNGRKIVNSPSVSSWAM